VEARESELQADLLNGAKMSLYGADNANARWAALTRTVSCAMSSPA
jgi:hypothetical protein